MGMTENCKPGSRGRSAADNVLHAQICAWMADPDPNPKLPMPADAWLAIQSRSEQYVKTKWGGPGLTDDERDEKIITAMEHATRRLRDERQSRVAVTRWAHVDAQVEALAGTIATLEGAATATPEALAGGVEQLQKWVEAGGAIRNDQGTTEALAELAAAAAALQARQAGGAPVPDLAGTVAVLQEWHAEGLQEQRGQHWGVYIHGYIRGVHHQQGAERWIPEAEKFVHEVHAEVKGRTLAEAVDIAIQRSHTYRSDSNHRQQFDCPRGVTETWIRLWAEGAHASVEAEAELGQELVSDADTSATAVHRATTTPGAAFYAEEALEQLGWNPDSGQQPTQILPEPVVAFLDQQGRLADLVRQGWELRDAVPVPIDPAHLTHGAAQVRELVPPWLQDRDLPAVGPTEQLGFGF